MKTFLPHLRMQPQLVLWPNHQIEIISVTWVCGTPAWGFDRWECQRLHLQTRARGNSHQTSYVERDMLTLHCTGGQSVKRVTRTFAGEKGEETGESIWKCVRKRRETVPRLPYCFLISELYMWLWIQAVSKQGVHHQYARPIEMSSLVLIIAMTPSRWVLNMHEMNITHF